MTKVMLGATEYDVPEMDIGQIESISALDPKDRTWQFKVLAIMMRDASPKISDIRKLKAAPPQIAAAIKSLMVASGYDLPNPEAPDQPGLATEAQVES